MVNVIYDSKGKKKSQEEISIRLNKGWNLEKNSR